MIMTLLLYLLALAGRLLLHWLNLRHLERHGAEVPAGFEGAVDRETLSRSSGYTRASSRLGLWRLLAESLVLLAFLFGGALPLYDRLVATLAPSFVGGGVVFFLGLQLAATLLALPFSLYRTFVLEARYGFNTTTAKIYIADLIKSTLLSALILAGTGAAALALVQASPQRWWFWVWSLFALASLCLQFLSPLVIEPLFFKFEPVRKLELRRKLEGMMARAGLAVSQVLQVDASRRSRHSNAYFTGIGRVKRIVLFDTLLAEMNDAEILAVLAHETGHWRLGHVRNRLLATGVLSLAACYGASALLGWPGLPELVGETELSFCARVILLAFLWRIAAFFIMPLGAAFSRRQERQADAYATTLSGDPRSLAAALIKLSRNNLANLHPHPLYAAVYYHHPPVVHRVARLLTLSENGGTPPGESDSTGPG